MQERSIHATLNMDTEHDNIVFNEIQQSHSRFHSQRQRGIKRRQTTTIRTNRPLSYHHGKITLFTIIAIFSASLIFMMDFCVGFNPIQNICIRRMMFIRTTTIDKKKMCSSNNSSGQRRRSIERSKTSSDTIALLNSENEDNDLSKKKRKRDLLKSPFSHAKQKFLARPGTYLLIPIIAAFVGWFTNYLAVQMIFYPINYKGLSLIRKPEVPLGLLGWQGIVPCKTRTMSLAMVDMVTSQLLSVETVFRRLDPRRLADLLSPEVPKLAQSIVDDLLPSSRRLATIPKSIFLGLPERTRETIAHWNYKFLVDFVKDVQSNVGSVLSVENCVVNQMMTDRSLLGTLFRKCGQAELDFLTNSGLWFGFLLGLIQMAVALFWENPWSLSIGGGIVGLATNWLALKWIFEPVNPTAFGPFVLQGQFLRRQKEVAKEFSRFFANNVLTSDKLWHSMLTDPGSSPMFNNLFKKHLIKYVALVTGGLKITPEPEVIEMAAKRAIEKLPNHIGVLHQYVDETLMLEDTLRVQMEKMSSAKFERVLHPIFEEDELTLILAGAVLGFLAGLVQQGLETGAIRIPTKREFRDWVNKSKTNIKLLKGRIRDFKPRRATLDGIQKCKSIFRHKVLRRNDTTEIDEITEITQIDEVDLNRTREDLKRRFEDEEMKEQIWE